MRAKIVTAALAACACVAATAAPAGPDGPMILRTVTIDGVTAPAYYSVVENRYIFVGGATLHAEASDWQLR